MNKITNQSPPRSHAAVTSGQLAAFGLCKWTQAC